MVKKWDDGMKRLFWVAPQDFASWLVPSDQRWLERRKAMLEDILRDSWVYQDILKKGLEEG